MSDENKTPESGLPHMPDAETIRQELGKAKNINDLTGKDGVFARLFGQTLTAMLEGELSGHLGYERGAYGDELVEAAARILSCHWQETGIAVVGVIPVPSLRRPALVPSFAQRLAAALGLPYATVIPHQSQHPPQHEMRNSFQQAVKLLGKYSIAQPLKGNPVLLVDDIADSKWTLTVLGDLLQRHGSGKVYTFALAVTNMGE